MKRVYEVHFQHKHFVNDEHKPWVIARTAAEASKKGRTYLKAVKLPVTQMELIGVKAVGTIEVE